MTNETLDKKYRIKNKTDLERIVEELYHYHGYEGKTPDDFYIIADEILSYGNLKKLGEAIGYNNILLPLPFDKTDGIWLFLEIDTLYIDLAHITLNPDFKEDFTLLYNATDSTEISFEGDGTLKIWFNVYC